MTAQFKPARIVATAGEYSDLGVLRIVVLEREDIVGVWYAIATMQQDTYSEAIHNGLQPASYYLVTSWSHVRPTLAVPLA